MNNTDFVRVWDLPTRIFHWLLVGLVITSFVTAEIGGNAMQYHMWCGYAILTLLLFRLIWGFIGSTTARFTSFVRGPAAAWRYARSLPGKSQPHLGHNPLGGWSILAMLLALLVQVGSGLFATDDIATQGPLYPLISDDAAYRLTSIHLFNPNVIIALVCLHFGAVLFYLIVKRDNLIAPMITGRRARQAGLTDRDSIIRPAWLALVVTGLCALGVYFLVQ